MLVPGAQHLLGEGGVLRVQRDRCPVDVPHEDPPARSKRTMHLGQCHRRVGDVLEDLHAQRGIEAGIVDG